MKAELTLPTEMVDLIADRVIEKLMPLLSPSCGAEQDELLNIKEASEFLKVSKDQIYQWVNYARHGLGTFPYKKLGKQLRFSRNELIEWMENNKTR
jgi:excisionase family DNA binding protein